MPELHDIIGQDEAVARLRGYLHSGRMPHAFLFAGPAGVGRRTTAVALARLLLCEGAASADAEEACGQCEGCRMMDAGSHPDFHMIYKELARYHEDPQVRSRVMQELGIDVVRRFLIAPAGMSSARGQGKVFVVLEAELLSIPAQNALLKTLEEPPAGTIIILICSRPDQLLPTTLSRCAMVRFRLLPRQFVAGKVTEAGIGKTEAEFWAAFTDGSLGRALKLAQQGMYQVTRELLDSLAGLSAAGDAELGDQLAKATDSLAAQTVAEARKADGAELSKMLATRRAAGAMLELIASAYRDAISLATGTDRQITNADQSASIKTLAARFQPAQLAEIIESLSRFEQLLWRNVNPRIVWDNVVIACATAAPLEV